MSTRTRDGARSDTLSSLPPASGVISNGSVLHPDPRRNRLGAEAQPSRGLIRIENANDTWVASPPIVLPIGTTSRRGAHRPGPRLTSVDASFEQKKQNAERWGRVYAHALSHDMRSEVLNFLCASLLWELDQIVDDMLLDDDVVWSCVEQFKGSLEDAEQYRVAQPVLAGEGLTEAFATYARAYADASFALRAPVDDLQEFMHLRCWSGGLVFPCYLCSPHRDYFDVAMVATALHDLYDFHKDKNGETSLRLLHDYFEGEDQCITFVKDVWFRIAEGADGALRAWMDRWVAWQSSEILQTTRGYDAEHYRKLDRIFGVRLS